MFFHFYFILQILAISINTIASSNVEQNVSSVNQNHDSGQLVSKKTSNVVYSDSIVGNATSNTVPIKISSAENKTEKGHSRRVTDTAKIPDVPPIPGDYDNLSNHSTNSSKLVPATPETLTSKTPSVPSKTPTKATTFTTTSTTTTTTTTAAPKKPTLTVSVEDDPRLRLKIDKTNIDLWNSNVKSNGHEISPDGPITLQSSEEIEGNYDGRQYIVPMVGVIFAIPFVVIVGNSLTRRLRDYWSKRKYRRMDYLIEDMYN